MVSLRLLSSHIKVPDVVWPLRLAVNVAQPSAVRTVPVTVPADWGTVTPTGGAAPARWRSVAATVALTVCVPGPGWLSTRTTVIG